MELSNEAYTPDYFIDPIREFAHGFDFDPYSSNEANQTIQAKYFCTIHSHELPDFVQNLWLWEKTLWVNPPYSTKELKQAIAKVIEFKEGKEIYLLLNTDNSTEAYKLCLQHCTALMLVSKRIKFVRPYATSAKDQNNRAQTLFFFGSNDRAVEFKHQLSRMGKIFIND